MKKQGRVVITGMGLITPLGIGVQETLVALQEGKCGISFGDSKNYLGSNFWPDYYGTVKGFDPKKYIRDSKSIRKTTRNIHLAVSAAQMAMSDAQWTSDESEEDFRSGVVIAMGTEDNLTGFNGVLKASLNSEGKFDYALCGSEGSKHCAPLYILPRLPNTAAGQTAIQNHIKGINFSIVNIFNGGAISVGEAYRAIRGGRANRIIAGGCNSTIGLTLPLRNNLYNSVMDLSHRGSVPFSADRKGYIPAEGASFLILESEESALSRQARIYAEISSYTNLYNPYAGQNINLERKHYARVMKKTIELAGIPLDEIDAVNASGIGLPLQDAAESLAIRDVFGTYTDSIPVSANKSQSGYMETASSALEICISAISVYKGLVPSTIRHVGGDALCDCDYVTGGPRQKNIRHVLSNSYDLKGSMCGFVISKWNA